MNQKGTFKVFLIVASAVILILAILFSALYFINKNSYPDKQNDFKISTNEPKSLSDCPNIKDVSSRDYCYYTFFVLKGQVTSLDDCKKIISNTASRDSCYGKLAEIRGDKSICDNYQNSYFKPLCLSAVACKTGDISTCEMFEKTFGSTSSDTVLCYRCVAIRNNDGTICSKIMDNGVREDCFSNFKDASFNPNTAFTVTGLSCGDESTSLTVKLNQEIGLIDFKFMLEGPTQGFCAGGCSGCANPKSMVDKNLQVGKGKTYNINYADNCLSGAQKPTSLRIAFTTDKGDYSTDKIAC